MRSTSQFPNNHSDRPKSKTLDCITANPQVRADKASMALLDELSNEEWPSISRAAPALDSERAAAGATGWLEPPLRSRLIHRGK